METASTMFVEAILTLVRLSETEQPAAANLAKAALSLVEQLRDFEARADLAEARLAAEQAKSAAIRQALSRVEERADVSGVLLEIVHLMG